MIVTGAAQGIGRAIATMLAVRGSRVLGVDQDAAAVEEWASRHPDLDVIAYDCDLGSAEAIEALWWRLDRAERPDRLVNNAGIFYRQAALEVAAADWDRVLAVNLRGSFLMAQALAHRVIARRVAGSIVSVSSGQAYRPASRGVAYAASKAGLSNMARALATEWGPYGIRVNTVVPGLTDTTQPRAHRTDADFLAAAAGNPLRRLSTPDDVARTVCFLLSEEASTITGQAVAVNAGRLML